jgi:hypothetical protein
MYLWVHSVRSIGRQTWRGDGPELALVDYLDLVIVHSSLPGHGVVGPHSCSLAVSILSCSPGLPSRMASADGGQRTHPRSGRRCLERRFPTGHSSPFCPNPSGARSPRSRRVSTRACPWRQRCTACPARLRVQDRQERENAWESQLKAASARGRPAASLTRSPD